MSATREPLATKSNTSSDDNTTSRSTVKFSKDADLSKSRVAGGAGAGQHTTFSVLSSGMPSSILAEELIMRGAKKKITAQFPRFHLHN